MAISPVPIRKIATPSKIRELTEIGQQAGLGEQVAKVTQKQIERPGEIFSGGFISDIFDSLNALQYGVTGLIKGKTFKQGVRTRQSFTDKDALGDLGIPGVIAGLALDIAVDPLTYIPILGWGTKALKGVKKGGKAVGKQLAKIPAAKRAGDVVGRSLIYRYGQDPIYKAFAERSIRSIAIGQQNVIDIAKPLVKLDGATQRTIGAARKLGKLDTLSPKVLAKAKPAFDKLDELGAQAVRVGLLDKKIYDENVGKYIARLYREKEIGKKALAPFAKAKPKRIDITRFMKRKDIPDVIRESLGEILEAGYPTAKSLVQLTTAVEQAKLFNRVAKTWGSNAIKEGFEKLPVSKRLGDLAGMYVPKAIFDDIQEIIRPVGGVGKKLVAGFKYGKVILNPATHSRNIMSNFILNNFEGLNPARIDIYGEAARQLATKGKWYKEAVNEGLGLNTFAAQEIKNILFGPEVGKLKTGTRKVMDKIADLYQGEENFAKMAQFIFQRKKGLSATEAWKVAERATFNYTQVTPFIRKLRESLFGFPFITFTYKVTPQVLKTAIKAPTKISNIGKIKTAIESLSDEKTLASEREAQPDYIRNGLFVRMPNKDKYGRNLYFDLTYIVPFGDLVSGQFFSAEGRATTPAQAVFGKFPLLNTIKELSENKDFFGQDIVKGDSVEPHQQGRDIMKYLLKFYLPPLTEGPVEAALDKKVREKLGAAAFLPGRMGRSLEFEKLIKEDPQKASFRTTRTPTQELLRGFAGIKTTPFNLEAEKFKREKELRERLEKLLISAGVVKEFKRTFVPKE